MRLDAGWRCKVARNRKLPNSPPLCCLNHFILPQYCKFNRDNRGIHKQLRCVMSKARIYKGKITSLCCSELAYLFAFNACYGKPVALLHKRNERYSHFWRNYFAATETTDKIRQGAVSQWRNGSGFRLMAARPHTLSQLWRYLAAQANILSSVPGL